MAVMPERQVCVIGGSSRDIDVVLQDLPSHLETLVALNAQMLSGESALAPRNTF
jgi:hypothetical protein